MNAICSHSIRTYRKKHGLSQKEFGRLVGVRQSAVANYETGYRTPTAQVARKIHEKTNGSISLIVLRPDIFGPSPTQPIPSPPPVNEETPMETAAPYHVTPTPTPYCYPPLRTQTVLVCPTCKVPVQVTHQFQTADGVTIATYHCREHGDVVPMRSAVVNGSFQSENQI